MVDAFDKKILLSVPSAFSARNVLRSGILEDLQKEASLIVAAHPKSINLMRANLPNGIPVWGLPNHQSSRSHAGSLAILRNAFFDRHQINSREMLLAYRHRDKQRSFRTKIRGEIYRALSPLGWSKQGYEWLVNMEDREFRKTIPPDYLEKLRSANIQLGFSTVFVSDQEWVTFRSMQMLGIPTVTHILSFDNLTSHGYIPLRNFNVVMVWSETLARELEEYYEIPRSKIKVTGTPQFDFHIHEDFRWSRELTYQKLGLDFGRPYFLYCANHYIHTPREPELIASLLLSFQNDPEFKQYQFVLRLHPYDDEKRWLGLTRNHPDIQLSRPWIQDTEDVDWAIPTVDEVALLSNSIRYASAVFSVGSTIALDCAVLDIPVINLGYHPDKGSLEDIYYYNVHHSHHYTPITESNAAPVAYSLPEFLCLVQEAVKQPESRAEFRKQLRNLICGPVDGKSTTRVIEVLRRLLR